ncbi:MAG: response regulator [Chloroflexi bacterium]|nr:response regulator [Chloroflexota bacterium]
MTKRRIVIAEDEPLARLDLSQMLENLGHDVVGQAGDGQTAVDLARDLKPDLVIMDIKMPGDIDGLGAATLLADERVAPVLLLTAYSDQEFIDGARDAGVMGYLVKPYGENQLAPAIEVALARFGEFSTLQKELGSTKEALMTRKIVERAKGVLMDTAGLKESEAFHRIQRLSMNSRKSMREVAEAILLTHGIEQPR